VNAGSCLRALDAKSILLQASRHPLAHVASQGLADAGVGGNDPLVLAVSGGGDSMAMLVLLASVRSRADDALASLSAVSIDHGIRSDSAAEASFACETARALGIGRAEVIAVDVPRDGNLLDAARNPDCERSATTRARMPRSRSRSRTRRMIARRAFSLVSPVAAGLTGSRRCAPRARSMPA